MSREAVLVERLPLGPEVGRGPDLLVLSVVPDRRGATTRATLQTEARAISARLGRPFTSRSYAGAFALVAAHDHRVGIDLEAVAHFEGTEAESILTEREVAMGLGARDELCTSAWSGKEALAKALGDARRYDPRRLDSPLTWPTASAGRWRAEPLGGLPAGHVGWVCWQLPPSPVAPSRVATLPMPRGARGPRGR